MTPDLPAFLTARWDEEERVARAAAEPWESDSEGGWFAGLHEETIEHTARHNPDRVLADLDAKRKIAELHEFTPWYCRCCEEPAPCRTVRLLALPYAAHPDYRQEWAP